jgi:hypothetical protein
MGSIAEEAGETKFMEKYVGWRVRLNGTNYKISGVSANPLRFIGPSWFPFREIFRTQYGLELVHSELPIFTCVVNETDPLPNDFEDPDLTIYQFKGGFLIPPEICHVRKGRIIDIQLGGIIAEE